MLLISVSIFFVSLDLFHFAFFFFFFFQAEDGIRDLIVTGVQTCALPISTRRFLELAGFYDRQRADFGYFITPDFIEQRQPVRITDLLSGLPGVSLVQTEIGRASCRERV